MTINPALELAPATVELIEQALAPVVLPHNEHDPYACQTCDSRPAALTATFPDGEVFEVCAECRTLAGALVTVTPLLGALVTA